ncbi:MAG: hypothetical protein COV66_03425 [Nitrospinae bacterium CG11_big_fil_rev_8_21_14_0_20_45_15]|nr:MAG: hypothetical protein COV66_03425 [Nitrospinae bacterium CG11_big_fil_rev_8_21_14_0_20_45_15]
MKQNFFCTKWSVSFFYERIFLLLIVMIVFPVNPSYADDRFQCAPPKAPYEAPPYVEPLKEPEISKLHLIDNCDGTITDPDSGLMWTQKDSYADLGKCLTWNESVEYVKKLDTRGFKDWRIPTIKEVSTLYDPTKENNMAWDHDPDFLLRLDEKFADGSAYWYWASDNILEDQKNDFAKTFYFVKGLIHYRSIDQCNNGGVRAVRSAR